ncbi:MAG: M1 family aminopeptidase, partial [bacterium]
VIGGGEGSGLSTGGDEANRVRRLSGFYQADRINGHWLITRQIPIDTQNVIRTQRVHVALAPGKESHIVDTLTVDVGSSHGFAVRLNTAARLSPVTLNGRPATFTQGGGLLWINIPTQKGARIALNYVIADEHEPRAKTDTTTVTDSAPAFGALNNTDAWLPFYGYDSGNAFADITVTATIPAEYRLTTTLPQSETVLDGVRTVHGRSVHPQFIVGLIYDRDWRVVSTNIGALRFESFLTPAFRFSHDTLATLIGRAYRLLTPRFGEPQRPSRYLAVVEHRALTGAGFTVRMNNAVISGDKAIILDEPTLGPSSTFAHEVSHGWTMNSTGAAANFLHEGWATFAESLILRDTYGAATERAFWEKLRSSYVGGVDRGGVARGFEGRQSILGDPDNGRIHYFKGSWLLHSLNLVLGDSVFDRAMREFISNQSRGSNGYREFIADMSHAAGHDMTGFIMPWLAEKYIPDVDARVDGTRLIVTQAQQAALFDLPLDVELVTATGTVRRAVHLTTRADTIDIASVGAVSEARVDPDHHFLLRRHWGEVVRFELRAPTATKVELLGSFTGKPAAATRVGDMWVVEMPLTEGRYLWQWRVDGKSATDEEALAAVKAGDADPGASVGVRTVRALQRLTDADAR